MSVVARSASLVLILCASALGQNRSAEALEPAFFDVTALDANGRFVPGLTAGDFEIFRAGAPLKIVKATAVDTHLNRTLVLVVDDLGLSREGLRKVRSALLKFVAEQVREGDRIAIVRTGASTGHLQQFTADATKLRAAIDLVEVHPLADPVGARPNSFTAGTLLQLRFVFDALKNTAERKAVVLLSERTSLPRSAGSQVLADVESSTSRMAELANQAMATFYAIEATPATRARLDTGLASVVKETGGLWIDDAADLSAALAGVCRDREGHYLLGFQPSERSYDYLSGRDLFAQMTVKARRPGVRVRARSAVYGSGDEKQADPDDAVHSPFAGGITVRATPIFAESPTEGSYIDVLLHIDAKRLTFVQGLNGQYRSVIEIVSMGFDESGQTIGAVNRVATLNLNEAGYRTTLENGLLYSQRVVIKRPGAYQIRSLVRDDAAGRTGSAGQYLEVPDLPKGDLTISGIVIRPGTNTPLDAASQMRQNAAVRVFKAGELFGYGYQIFNILSGGELQGRITRDGADVFIGKPTVIAESGPDANVRVISGAMALGTDMAPGRYRFEVVVTGKPAEQRRTAVQSIDFEIRN